MKIDDINVIQIPGPPKLIPSHVIREDWDLEEVIHKTFQFVVIYDHELKDTFKTVLLNFEKYNRGLQFKLELLFLDNNQYMEYDCSNYYWPATKFDKLHCWGLRYIL